MVVGSVVVNVVDIDVAACCWHGRVEVTPHVQSQLAMESDCGVEREEVDAFGENDIHPVMSDRDEAVVVVVVVVVSFLAAYSPSLPNL